MIYLSNSPEETDKIAQKIATAIKNGGIIFLTGDLGSGKTAFVKGLAHSLGIEKFAVKSPTYTYIRHYKVGRVKFYHIDLYRLDGFDELLAAEIQEICHEKNDVIAIEWADKITFELPKHRYKIAFEYLGKKQRKITVGETDSKQGSAKPSGGSKFDTEQIYQKYKTPLHVIRHCKKVAYLAEKIGGEFLDKGWNLDLGKVIDAALVHDGLRVCDFRDFDEENFQNVSKNDLKVWKQLRKKYGKKGHAKAMGDILKTIGYPEIANLVYKHDFHFVDELRTLEEKILYYADKRVNLDKVVSLKTRLLAGKKRNLTGKSGLKERKDIVEKIYRLEKELSKLLGKNLAKIF
ncbi:tRNA (adenosine(37)-N6)-threonylcarbamoyltransferase complex ATPase subunit type 1 TsaE [Candidatus Peregrinibacteria bacterium]|nr:tRNA (adenosine(37)-N6)-threonylcarbamoyltransferase complex ATPase subunit type 1 TsaE [Candidatus Peregrinibacteria bacterium]